MEDDRPWNGHWTFDEVASLLREQTPDDQAASLAAYDGTTLVGAGLVMYSLVDNTDKAYVFPMVDPPARGAAREAHWWRPWSTTAARPAARR